jgi:hypothetical protein
VKGEKRIIPANKNPARRNKKLFWKVFRLASFLIELGFIDINRIPEITLMVNFTMLSVV